MHRNGRRLTAAALCTAAAALGLPSAASAADVDLLTDPNVMLTGAAPGDIMGNSVAPAGDINGDGREDVVVGGWGPNPHGRDNAGSAYVIYGAPGADPADVDLANVGARGFRIDGATSDDSMGYAVSGAGDLNGDGRDDLIVSADQADVPGVPYGGAVYVIYGSSQADPPDIDTAEPLGDRGFVIRGDQGFSEFASAVAPAGDVNGDGRDDVIFGADRYHALGRNSGGVAWVLYGSDTPDPADFDIADLGERGFAIVGADNNDGAGFSVAGAGDMNGDGRGDVLVGAYQANRVTDAGTGYGAGHAYVVYGSTEADPADVDLATLGARGFRMVGAAGGNNAGSGVSGGGDLNGDGRDDAIIGAYDAASNGRVQSGAAYVVYGASVADPADVDLAAPAERGFVIAGAAPNDMAGTSVASADANADGRPDIVVGASGASPKGRNRAGSAFVIYGSGSGDLGDIDLATLSEPAGFRIDGPVPNSDLGYSVASARNFNGDGGDDVIAGATGETTPNGMRSGAAHIVLGTPTQAADDTQTGQQDTPLELDIFANDGGGAKEIAAATSPAHGTRNGLTYTPAPGYCGSDSFSYTLVGGTSATVSLTIACKPSDAPPTAVNDAVTVKEDAGLTPIDVLANDTDSDGGPKLVTSVGDPPNGSAAASADGSGLAYLPDRDFCGTDSFTYALNGGSTATVTVTVTCVDEARPTPKISVKRASRRANKRGAVVRVRCGSATACRGTVRVRYFGKTGRKRAFALNATSSTRLRVQLPRRARVRLALRGSVRVTAVARVSGGKTVRRAMRVYAPRRR